MIDIKIDKNNISFCNNEELNYELQQLIERNKYFMDYLNLLIMPLKFSILAVLSNYKSTVFDD